MTKTVDSGRNVYKISWAVCRGMMMAGAALALLSLPPIARGEAAVPAGAPVGVQEKTPAQRLMERLKDPDSKYVLVSAHRADWRNFPENSLEAIESAIAMGVDIVEIDARKTLDGHFVLMHDLTVDRATTGKGKVSDLTLEEIKKLRLKNGCGLETIFTVPTLEEALLVAKGRVLVCLDKCSGTNNFPAAHQVLKRTGTLGQILLNVYQDIAQARNDLGPDLDDVVAVPILSSDKEGVEQQIPAPISGWKPLVLMFDFATPDYPPLLRFRDLRKDGTRVFVNTMWGDSCANHDDDRAVKDPDANYGWLLNLGATILQTDRPEFLIKYLKKKGLRE